LSGIFAIAASKKVAEMTRWIYNDNGKPINFVRFVMPEEFHGFFLSRQSRCMTLPTVFFFSGYRVSGGFLKKTLTATENSDMLVFTSQGGFFFCALFSEQREANYPIINGGAVMRVRITLACTECKQRNYNTIKNKKEHTRQAGDEQVLQVLQKTYSPP
jgi:hypothetical protein